MLTFVNVAQVQHCGEWLLGDLDTKVRSCQTFLVKTAWSKLAGQNCVVKTVGAMRFTLCLSCHVVQFELSPEVKHTDGLCLAGVLSRVHLESLHIPGTHQITSSDVKRRAERKANPHLMQEINNGSNDL